MVFFTSNGFSRVVEVDGIGTRKGDGIGTRKRDGVGTRKGYGIGTRKRDGIGKRKRLLGCIIQQHSV